MTNVELLAITRNADWKWAITSEDEWYKAAYHKNDGVTGNYWNYPTSSDHINTSMANYDWSVGHTTAVGAYPYPSPYDTFDQGGNVPEWNEAVVSVYSEPERGARGGAWHNAYYMLCPMYPSARGHFVPTYEGEHIGFRLTQVPEPCSTVLLLAGAIGFFRRRLCSNAGRVGRLRL